MMNKESLLKGCLLGILGFAAQWVTAQTFDNETVTAIWGMSGGANRYRWRYDRYLSEIRRWNEKDSGK